MEFSTTVNKDTQKILVT